MARVGIAKSGKLSGKTSMHSISSRGFAGGGTSGGFVATPQQLQSRKSFHGFKATKAGRTK
jgi:hypothetical protein